MQEQKEIWADGEVFVGESNWRAMKKVPYVFEPLANACYVTTAALRGMDAKKGREVPERGVLVRDLERNVKSWIGCRGAECKYVAEVVLPLRVLPDENKDTVQRLTKCTGVVCRVVPSDKSAVVIGCSVYHELLLRKEERLEMTARAADEDAEILHRLDEMLDAARLEGMSEAGLKEAEKMLKEEFFDVWRLKLRPGDVAALPALRIELLKDEEFVLPRPYRRRYTPAEYKWWEDRMQELCDVGVLRKSSSGQLSPSNLIPKKLDGVVLPDNFRLVVDMRGVNKRTKPEHYGIPKLDTVIHHMAGSDCLFR